jgi:hypothetical protein
VRSTDAGFMLLRVHGKNEVQGQNAVKNMHISYSSSKMLQIPRKEGISDAASIAKVQILRGEPCFFFSSSQKFVIPSALEQDQ